MVPIILPSSPTLSGLTPVVHNLEVPIPVQWTLSNQPFSTISSSGSGCLTLASHSPEDLEFALLWHKACFLPKNNEQDNHQTSVQGQSHAHAAWQDHN